MHSLRFNAATLDLRLFAPALGILLLALAAGCNSKTIAPSKSTSPDAWATVDGRSITRDDVDKTFRQSQDPAAKLSPEEAMTLKLSILNEMILQDILLAKATALKIEVPATELDAAYTERKKNMTDATFEEELKKRSLSVADMRENLRRELMTKKLLDQEVVAKVAVTDQEINDFFNTNKAQFALAEESYRIGQIVITPDRAQQQVNRTGNDATTPEEAAFKVRMVMERLKAGVPFADVAMDYSEDPESVQRGGDLGMIPVSALNRAPEPLRKAVIGKSPGTVNVASSGGVHTIVLVVAHEQAGQRDLTTPGVKDGITATLKGRKEQLLRTAYLSAARGDAEVVNLQARRVVESQGKAQ